MLNFNKIFDVSKIFLKPFTDLNLTKVHAYFQSNRRKIARNMRH